jgi:hypothetical protein
MQTTQGTLNRIKNELNAPKTPKDASTASTGIDIEDDII